MTDLKRQDVKPVKGPRTHDNCKSQHGVFRPGKTAVDKARGVQRFHKNRRTWDDREHRWVKV